MEERGRKRRKESGGEREEDKGGGYFPKESTRFFKSAKTVPFLVTEKKKLFSKSLELAPSAHRCCC